MKACTIGSSLASSSSSVPRASSRPSCRTPNSSPTTRALGMLWVTTISVVPVRLVSTSRSSISDAGDRIEAGARLVDEQDRRIERHRPRQAGALLHAARQIAGHLVEVLFEADGRQLLLRSLADLVVRPVGVAAHREGDVVADAHRVEERRVLKQEAHVLADVAELAPFSGVMSRPSTNTCRRPAAPADEVPQQHALPGARLRPSRQNALPLGMSSVTSSSTFSSPKRFRDVIETDRSLVRCLRTPADRRRK
jgi:hypothetical protein